jgi:hypothetical protein
LWRPGNLPHDDFLPDLLDQVQVLDFLQTDFFFFEHVLFLEEDLEEASFFTNALYWVTVPLIFPLAFSSFH